MGDYSYVMSVDVNCSAIRRRYWEELSMLTEEMARVLRDSAASDWLKQTLMDAIDRDPVDAAVDAEILCQLLSSRAEAVLLGEMLLAPFVSLVP
jgi:hypothetical protein